MVRQSLHGEGGFTLVEVMIAIVLLTFGLLAVADVIPRGLLLGVYGKDQTRSASLGQQEIECLRNQAPSVLDGMAGDFGATRVPTPGVCNPGNTATMTTYFDQNGVVTTAGATNLYFTRDVQVQYWAYNVTTNAFALPAVYAKPAGTYMYRVAVATHWLVHGQTIYTSGQAVNGCVSGGTALPLGQGCVQVSSTTSP